MHRGVVRRAVLWATWVVTGRGRGYVRGRTRRCVALGLGCTTAVSGANTGGVQRQETTACARGESAGGVATECGGGVGDVLVTQAPGRCGSRWSRVRGPQRLPGHDMMPVRFASASSPATVVMISVRDVECFRRIEFAIWTEMQYVVRTVLLSDEGGGEVDPCSCTKPREVQASASRISSSALLWQVSSPRVGASKMNT